MEINVKETIATGAKWATLGGAVVIAGGAIHAITGLVKTKQAGTMKIAMPVVTLLVAVSAFSWAMTQPISILPTTGGAGAKAGA